MTILQIIFLAATLYLTRIVVGNTIANITHKKEEDTEEMIHSLICAFLWAAYIVYF